MASAAPPGPHTPSLREPGIEVLADATAALRVDEVVAAPAAARFASLAEEGRHTRFRGGAYWLRFTLENESTQPTTWLLELNPDSVDYATLYGVDGRGGFEVQKTGRREPFATRAVNHPTATFRLALAAAEHRSYYLRLQSEAAFRLEPTFWPERSFYDAMSQRRFFGGLYYGVLAAMVLYNLFVFASVRERAYVYYVVFQASVGALFATIDRLLFQYVWPNDPWLNAHASIVAAAAASFGALGFVREFLHLRDFAPRAGRALEVLAAGAIALGALGLVSTGTPVQRLGLAFVALVCLTLLAVGAYAWRRRQANAAFFLLAWLALLGGALLDAASTVGWLPPFFVGAPKVGSAVEAMLLAFALADRINQMRRETARAQAARLEAEREHAQRLERRVDERTRELADALAALTATQDRMLRNARLAALGHLITGVAHEIGNPLNYALGGARELLRRLEAIARGFDALPPEARALPAVEPTAKAIAGAQRAGRVAAEGAERIRRIVENLRSYSASSSVAASPTALDDELRTTFDLLDTRLASHGITVELDLAPLPLVLVRPGEMSQVFTNLILNSHRAMPNGGTLRVRGVCIDGTVELTFQAAKAPASASPSRSKSPNATAAS